MKGSSSDVTAVDFGTSPAATLHASSRTPSSPARRRRATTPTTSSKLNAVTRHSGGVLVSVTTTDGEVAIGPSYHYVVEKRRPRPCRPSSRSGPTGGSAAGGNTVDVYGTGFTGATKVTFGGEAATSFKVLSDVQIAAVAPKLTTASCLAASHAVATLGAVPDPGAGHRAGRHEPGRRGEEALLGVPQLQPAGPSSRCPRSAAARRTRRHRVRLRDGVSPCPSSPTRAVRAVARRPERRAASSSSTAPGFNVLTLNWVDFGPPSAAASEDPELLSAERGGHEARRRSRLPDPNPGPNGDTVPVSVATRRGVHRTPSRSPTRRSRADRAQRPSVLPSAGGTTLTIIGGGFLGTQEVVFAPFNAGRPTRRDPQELHGRCRPRRSRCRRRRWCPGAYEVVVCNEYACGTGDPEQADHGHTVPVIYPGATAVTSAEADPAAPSRSPGRRRAGPCSRSRARTSAPLATLTVYLVNELGEQVAATGLVAGPAPTDPGRDRVDRRHLPGEPRRLRRGLRGRARRGRRHVGRDASALFTYT